MVLIATLFHQFNFVGRFGFWVYLGNNEREGNEEYARMFFFFLGDHGFLDLQKDPVHCPGENSGESELF